jgi:hypothetical protein
MHQGGEIRWVEASYTAIHQVLTNPVYAGAYVYGRTRHEIVLDATGGRKKRVRHLPRRMAGADPGACCTAKPGSATVSAVPRNQSDGVVTLLPIGECDQDHTPPIEYNIMFS